MYHEKYGYISGPYDKHPEDSSIKISSQHSRTCGFDASCTQVFRRLADLRKHLRGAHGLRVLSGSTGNTMGEEREWAQRAKGMVSDDGERVQVAAPSALEPTFPPPREPAFGTILWFSVKLPEDVSANQNAHVERHSDALVPNTYPLWFTSANMAQLRNCLGPGHAYANGDQRILHQSVVTAEILKHNHHRSVLYFKDVFDVRAHITQHVDSPPTLVYLNLKAEPSKETIEAAYSVLATVLRTHDRLYPSQTEYHWDKSRFADIQLLDQIAAEHGTYRPKTCFAGVLGRKFDCILGSSKLTVLKRAYSSDTQHVEFIPAGSTKAWPSCQSHSARLSSNHGEFYDYVHQEYVKTLVDYGEVRVFIVMEHELPTIVHKIRTKQCVWNPSHYRGTSPDGAAKAGRAKKKRKGTAREERYLFQEVIDKRDALVNAPECTAAALEDFALTTYRALLSRHLPGLESLKVGARLDIGIAPDNKTFFVNEITRWYDADYFQKPTLGPPQDSICKAFAGAFNAVVLETGNVARADTFANAQHATR